MSVIPEFFLNAVVSIGELRNNVISWFGTGFFVTRKVTSERSQPFLVTNRHVLENRSSIIIRLKNKDDTFLKEIPVSLVNNGEKLYQCHPNSKIDIAVLLLNGNFITENKLDFQSFDIDEHALTSYELRSEGVNEGTLIYMLGYPMGLVNINSNLPICRLGCIARISEEQIKEANNILIDVQNFPGNSGSPIVLRPEMMSIEGTKSLNKAVLCGVVHSYIPYKEQLVNTQTQQVVEIRSENSGLAWVHPVEYIREVIDIFLKIVN